MTNYSLTAAAQTVAEGIVRNGGATVSVGTGQSPDRGYVVSLPGHEETYDVRHLAGWGDDMVRANVAHLVTYYTERNVPALTQPGRYLGAWLDGNVLYLDVSEVYSERAAAEAAGRDRGQLAIYDVEAGEEIRLSPRPRGRFTAAAEGAEGWE